MNRLLSKIRLGSRDGARGGNGLDHVRVPVRWTSSRTHYVVTAAETASCTCPDFCERDHDNE
jgi:hypothetical protein